MADDSSRKQQLVEQIKANQRVSEEFAREPLGAENGRNRFFFFFFWNQEREQQYGRNFRDVGGGEMEDGPPKYFFA